MRPFNKKSGIIASLMFLLGTIGLVKLYLDFQVPFAGVLTRNVIGFYFFAGMVLFSTLLSLLKFFRSPKNTSTKVWMFCFSLFLSIVIAEFTLRLLHVNSTYPELRWNKYTSPYTRVDRNYLHVILPHDPKFLETPEFKYPRIANNKGFRDNDFLTNSDSSKILIQVYGDSFTEGDGAPMDSSYPELLNTRLNSGGNSKFLVQNFGVCGSDPAFYLNQFEKIGGSLNPNILVINYGTLDYTVDFLTRGGLERFKNGYTVSYPPPKWEIVYAYSFISRLIILPLTGVEYSYSFINATERRKRLEKLKIQWNDCFKLLFSKAANRGIRILLVKKPERAEILSNHYDVDFSFFETGANLAIKVSWYDLLPYYRDSAQLNSKNINVYYWEKDGHHNSKGYQIMANGVYNGLKKSFPDLFADR